MDTMPLPPLPPKLVTNVNSSFWQALWGRKLKTTLALLGGGLLWWLILWIWRPSSLDLNAPIGFIWIVPVAIWGVYLNSVFLGVRHEFYNQFALANGMTYQKTGWEPQSPAAFFSLGHSKQTSDIVSGQFDGNAFKLFIYQYTEGSGKHRHTYTYTAAQIDYPGVLPEILLVLDREFFGGITLAFPNRKKIEVEGQFDKNYDLYCKNEYEIEALQIFTPDVMEKLLTTWPKFNLEFCQNQLLVFCGHVILTQAELEQMRQLIEYLITKIEPVAMRMQSSLKTMQEYKQPN